MEQGSKRNKENAPILCAGLALGVNQFTLKQTCRYQ